ncbi:bifunctional protein-serine/threonine kinase/phosphatase [Vibrio sp. SCSIO 43136]|uniref:bifunctional protein-serine/threonine kinase/phosphatase n=1 Tax=Vibrio sp. SCSIO 43136 TaxID=2819101 RepID=UPI0020757A7B|nr:bifunctional protein-serine/threonine kinase/phosphatase [Vibrio sp. SCSIO 43136]USD67044.1 bifunctional protein-serine/threonine kinase/phosphatase [Vibrio sp. SCSIO 43136]
MLVELKVDIAQITSAGIKQVNQDAIGAKTPSGHVLESKGVVVAMADGISSSQVSQVASETAIKSFISDYFSTSNAWSVKHSATKVLQALNYWLYAQGQQSIERFNPDKGYVCTFSALILKSHTAHLVSTGDTRIYRFSADQLEQLSEDHRRVVDASTSYLTKALGIGPHLEADYRELTIEKDDIFVIATDGIYEFVSTKSVVEILQLQNVDLEQKAQKIEALALENGSDDNLSLQLVKIEQLPSRKFNEVSSQLDTLQMPPSLSARQVFDGYVIERALSVTSRSHIYLAKHEKTGRRVALKIPSAEMRTEQSFLESILMEEWVGQKLNSPYLLEVLPSEKRYLYVVAEYLEGQPLAAWLQDNPNPPLAKVRDIITQVAKGLQAMHRQQMIHQDLRPNNVMIDANGSVKIIDYGAVHVAGIGEIKGRSFAIPGTAQFSAPEYFIGELATQQADVFSLGALTYFLLTQKLPYGAQLSNCHNKQALAKLKYQSVRTFRPDIPQWVDYALKKATHLETGKRYQEVSEFVYDFTHESSQAKPMNALPLIERDPVKFWQVLSLGLFVMLCITLLG